MAVSPRSGVSANDGLSRPIEDFSRHDSEDPDGVVCDVDEGAASKLRNRAPAEHGRMPALWQLPAPVRHQNCGSSLRDADRPWFQELVARPVLGARAARRPETKASGRVGRNPAAPQVIGGLGVHDAIGQGGGGDGVGMECPLTRSRLGAR